MEMQFDIITIGDSTVDTFIKIHDASVECDINHLECKICVRYGDKIPVDAIGHGVAGNAANVATGAAILGLKTAIYTNLGDDQTGRLIKKSFEKNRVSGAYVTIHPGRESNLSVILTFQGERTAFVYHQNWYYHLPNLASCSWLYFTSVAESFTNSNITDEICHYLDRGRAKFAYSPGTFQLKADVKRFPRLLERCDLFIVNLEEAKKILNINPKELVDAGDLLPKLQLMGPKLVVITDGAEGSYSADGKRRLKIGVFPVQVYEKTGAGDAYACGLICGLFYGLDLAEAMVWGTINAAHVISELGPQNGLLSKEEIERHRATTREIVATTF